MNSFWKDLVLGQQATMVVNLCSNVGDNNHWYSECSQYWPISTEQPIEDQNIKVTLQEVNQVCSTLILYKLCVQQRNRRGVVEKESQVTLCHFSGWPDLDCPNEDDEKEGFNNLMKILLEHYII